MTPLDESQEPERITLEMIVDKRTEVAVSKPIYYTVSALTLGLPQSINHYQKVLKRGQNIHQEQKNYRSSLIIYLTELGLAQGIIAAQVGTIGYSYYSILEKLINH